MQRIDTEYIPTEDQDTLMALATAPEGTSISAMRQIIEQLQAPLLELQREGSLTRVLFVSPSFGATVPSQAFSRISMVPWNQRDYSAFDLRARMMAEWRDIPGIRVMALLPSGAVASAISVS
jgi:multidrug efflux pump